MGRRFASLLLGWLTLSLWVGATFGGEIRAFCGAALRPPLEELAKKFEGERGVRVSLTFGASGTVLSQMKLSRSGDVYIPGSSEYLREAMEQGLVRPETERRIAFLIPAILVRRGNPKGILGLEDLGRPGVRVAIGNPETVAVGSLAREILQFNGLWERVRANVVTYAETGPKLVSLLLLGAVDAVIGFRVFGWGREGVEVIDLKPEEVPRVGWVAGAVSLYSADVPSAQGFLDFLAGERGKEVFRKWGYVVDKGEALKFTCHWRGRGG